MGPLPRIWHDLIAKWQSGQLCLLPFSFETDCWDTHDAMQGADPGFALEPGGGEAR
jgi:hypothetical protein